MSLVARPAKNHPQQVGRRGANPAVDDRATTLADFEPLNGRFGGFTIDVAAAAHNAKCERYYSIEDDGLTQSWARERVWCNPPYSSIEPWVAKAHLQMAAGCELIVMLLPANRTEQGWWQRHVEPYRDGKYAHQDHRFWVEFLPGRMRFIAPGQTEVGPNERPPFGCCLLIWCRR